MILAIRSDARALPLADGSVECVVTSPPYWGLRSYGVRPTVFGGDPTHVHEWIESEEREGFVGKIRWQHETNGRGEEAPEEKRLRTTTRRDTRPEAWGEISQGATCECGAWLGCLGLEPTPELYVDHLVEVFRELRRVLRDDGTLWVNMGDCYCSAPPGNDRRDHSGDLRNPQVGTRGRQAASRAPLRGGSFSRLRAGGERRPKEMQNRRGGDGLKPKDLVGAPWMLAFALRADGWWLRSEIIWHKTNPMPESVKDRPVRAHEQIFLLAKSRSYYFDDHAVREPTTGTANPRGHGVHPKSAPEGSGIKANASFEAAVRDVVDNRMIRSVWRFPTRPYKGAHFASFPEDLVEPCVKAGSRQGGIVLDPFAGTGTVGRVAVRLRRRAVLCDLSQEYLRDLLPGRTSHVQIELGEGT